MMCRIRFENAHEHLKTLYLTSQVSWIVLMLSLDFGAESYLNGELKEVLEKAMLS